jgi:arsenate reductase-like glutaredoxin family protein
LLELVEEHRSNATPTLVAGGRVIIGFRPEEYQAALAAD